MAISISAGSSQGQNAAANQSTVYGSGSMTLTVGNWSGLQSWGRVNIGGNAYSIAGPTAMSQGGSWGWSAQTTFNHDANSGYRGDVGVSVSHDIDGTTLHRGSATAATQGAIDYNRSANTPYYDNITRNSTTNIYVTYARTGSVNGPTTYVLERATNAAMSENYTTFSEGNQTVNSTTSYYFRMYAYGTEGGNKYSGVYGPYNGVPTAPTSVVGTASTSVSGRITVSWTVPSVTNGGITNYYIYRGGTYIGQTGNANTTYIDDGLTKGTSYTYTVVAYNAAGASVASSASTATQAPGSPYAPTLDTVVASTDTFGKVSLSWTAPGTAVGTIQNYYMYAVFNSIIEKTVSTGTNVTSGDITGLDERKIYTFYVRARNQFSVDNGAPGDLSNTINRKSPGPPTAPTSLTAEAPFSPPGTVDLEWVAPSDVGAEGATITGYTVYLAGQSTPIKTTTGTGTSTTIADLVPATSYTFNVRARNEIADTVGTFSVASNSVTATAQGEPEAPTGLTVVSDPLVAGRLILTWTPPVGYNTGFRVYTGADVLVANVSTPRLEIDNLTANTSYSYKVRARNPLTDLTNSPGGPASATVSGLVGATSTQTVPSISVTNNTNSTFVGTFPLVSTTATTMSYSRTASNIAFASVPVSGGSTVNNTNTNLNGTGSYTVTAPTTTSITFTKAGSDIPANTSTPSGTMTDLTNIIFNGSYTVLGSPAPDPLAKTVSYTRVSSNITSRAASGTITNNSNAVFNGQHTITDVTETTIIYPQTNGDIAESNAFGIAENKTNTDIFNGSFTLSDTPDHKTVEYSTGDLTYGENLITNPSMETVQTGSTTLRTNLCTNPGFETNVTGWTGTSASISRSSSYSLSGTYSGLVTPGSSSGSVAASATTVSGQVYTLSAWVYAEEATNVRLTVVSPSTTGTTTSITADTWTRVSVSFTANTTTTTYAVETVGLTQPFYLDNVLLEQTSELRPFFDGATTDALGWDYGWTGTANASTSTAKAATSIIRTNLVTNPSMESASGTVTVRTNLLPNPSFETNTTGWGAVTGTGTRITTDFYAGTTCLQFVSSGTNGRFGGTNNAAGAGPVLPNTAYTVSAWVKATAGLVIQLWQNQSNSSFGGVSTNSANFTATGSWQRISRTVTTAATAAYMSLSVGTSTSGGTVLFDACQIELGSTATPYFDGSVTSSDSDLANSWSGTAHASTSIQTGAAVVTQTGSAAGAIQSTQWSASGSKSLRVIPTGDNASYASSTWTGLIVGQLYTVLGTVRLSAALTGTLNANALKITTDSPVVTLTSTATNAPGTYEVRGTFTATATSHTINLWNGASAGNGDVWWDALLLEASPIVGAYFDGTTADTSIYDYKWSGAAHASTSVVEALAPSPLEFTGISASVLSSYSLSHSGNMSALVTPNGTTCSLTHTAATVAGAVYTYSAWVYATSARTLKLSADSTQGLTISVPATTWTRLSLSFTAEDTSTLLSILGTDSTTAFYVDDVMLQESGTVQAYFDGDTDAAADTWPVVYSWNGTPHASISTREVGETLPPSGAEILPPYGAAFREQSDAQLQIRYRSGWLG